MKHIVLSLLSFVVVFVSALAQDADNTMSSKGVFSVDADFLNRGEVRNGGLILVKESDVASFIIERTILGASYEHGILKTRVSAQHSGTWGSNEAGALSIYEAWVNINTKSGFFAKIGRQPLSYDDQRIFGADSWSLTAMSHDVLKLGWEGHGHKIHLFGAYNQDVRNIYGGTFFSGGIQPYKAMEALWYHYDVPSFPLGASVVFMNTGMQNGDDASNTTVFQQQIVGSYVSFTPKKWSAEAAFYYQFGHEEHGIPISAWMASGKTTLSPSTSVRCRLGYDFLSGDTYLVTPQAGGLGLIRHDLVRGFSSLYGSHHKFYGAMDFFYVTTYVAGFTPGLQNLYFGTTWAPVKKLTTDIAFHYLATATQLKNAKKSLGHELELSASWKFAKDAALSAGYTYMKGTETMEVLKRTGNDHHLHWGWIMLTVTPTIFKASAAQTL